ncbi:MAG: NAD(P)-dependent alcohol dehydrogenase [Alphaproteobacteria bacterium]|nr:NAD(P)-dependent alcohol dehydrogenase [Alphaproteobacteria bacterium]
MSGLPTTMRAWTTDRYGGPEVVRLSSHPVPGLQPGSVLVRVAAASVARGDLHLLTGRPWPVRLAGYGLLRPRQPVVGRSLAGEVVAAAADVTDVASGDLVFAEIEGGAFADYALVPANRVAPAPKGLSLAEAAALPEAGSTSLHAFSGPIALIPGERVIILGASGGVGTVAVQIAKAMGAEVTAVARVRHHPLLQRLRADRVIEPTDAALHTAPAAGEGNADCLLDLVGDRPLASLRALVRPTGTVVVATGGALGARLSPMVRLGAAALSGRHTKPPMRVLVSNVTRADLIQIAALVAEGRLAPVIERRWSLSEGQAALAHVYSGHAQGKSVIVIDPDLAERRPG